MKIKTEEELKSEKTSPITEKLQNLLAEYLYAKNLYNSFANYYKCNSNVKLYQYFTNLACTKNMMCDCLIDYVNKHLVKLVIPIIDEVDEITDEKEPFQISEELEKEHTKLVNDILDAALENHLWGLIQYFNSLCGITHNQYSCMACATSAFNLAKEDLIKNSEAIYQCYIERP